jgi:cystathionine beta-lyase
MEDEKGILSDTVTGGEGSMDSFKYDFISIMDRRGRDAYAVDGVGKNRWQIEPQPPKDGFDFIPMWVADMNFPTCPAVTDAIIERAKHPAFGYFEISDEYYESIIRWRQSSPSDGRDVMPHRDLQREHIGYENGVHGFVTSAVRVLTRPGESILLHSPNYVGFRSDTWAQGRKCEFSPLKMDAQGIWRMDLDDMARRIEENDIHVMIFCSPQNPSGRVWERSELEAMMEMLEAHSVDVICDEIWADLTFEGHPHTPLQDVSPYAREHVLAAYAPSKTFNIAGLIGSYHIIYNDELRKRVTEQGSLTNYNEINVLSMHALTGGYSETGREWLNELNRTLEGNGAFALDYIRQNLPGIKAAKPQGTYMMWLDLSGYLETSGKSLDEILHAGWDVGVGWQSGVLFEGPSHIRLNLASPLSRIQEAFRRMKEHVFI